MHKNLLPIQRSFVRPHPLVRRNERERLMVLGAAGMTLALIVLMVVVLNSRSEASLKPEMVQPAADPARLTIGTVTLYVPERDVPVGTKLSAVKFKEVYWPRNNVPPGAIRDLAMLQSMYAKAALSADVPVVQTNLSSKPTEGPLMVTAGYRAISVEIDDVSGVDMLVQPGTRVDVMLTFTQEQQKVTRIIVQNARVLSFAGTTERDIENSAPASWRNQRRSQRSTVTLEVLPTDALKIQNARNMGKLALMMRPMEDSSSPDVTEVDGRMVAGLERPVAQPARNACNKGTVRMAGQEYTVNCDGTIAKVINPNEP